ncbi:IS1634 family transposase [Mycolicibacterium sp. CH28]|uniref:IS1634 family transposase n=4 Tax=Mycolicibacterium sp. CH28 TaxID=2512237 RepID=UPI001080A0B8|nr:IS1634 family transposase [Mycolicibacterium sp. CH28]TGD83736.1 IS1634 family transposase [Mycolicibacterium sp. CH28]TGD88982.1 IS1634 family transposase [Mycolicibacterium sp. CH28]TGD90570.1 IS1634 family transposase [Mycolicibacterium sp. CH28]
MAYVRKVRTASGAVAVQVVRKHRGQRTILAHVGSAHTDAELGILVEAARRIAAADQGALDIEVAARTQRVDDVADWRTGTLSLPTAGVPKGAPVPPGRTTSTCSRLLYDTLGAVYDWLGFDAVDDPVFRDLVIARLVEPTSKADSARVLTDLGAEIVSYKTIQRHLSKVNTGNYRDVIAGKCFTHASNRGGLSLLLYDVTTLYFEAENEDDLRKVGYSKERRIDPQIVVGLLVDRTGFPLEVGCFEGNTAETTTLVPIITAFQSRHDLGDTPMVIAADAGMLSASNLTALDEAGLGFIVGSRSVKAPIDLASHFHWNGDVFTDGQVIDTVTPRHAKSIVNDPAHRAEPAWNPDEHPNAWRAVWAYSAKRARRDQKTLYAQETRARAVISGERAAKSTRFVTTRAGDRVLDEASLARAQSLVGLKGYVTNIDATVMPAGEIIAKYHDLWHVERSFRMSKSDLRARPMFHRTRDAIEAHLTIVFTALAVAHNVQDRSGLAIAKVIKSLRPLRSATIAINGASQTFPPEIPATQQEILTTLGIPKPGH